MEKELTTQTRENNAFKNPPNIALSNFSDWEIKEAQNHSGLLSITVLLGNNCNLNCLYCYRNAGKEDKHNLSLFDWENIIAQAKNLGARNVWIPGSGEPMLDKYFYNNGDFPFLKICKELNLSVTFFTNGTHFTDSNLEELKDFDISIITKLNSFNPTIQDYLAGKRGCSEEIYEGLKLLLKHGFNKSTPTYLGIDTVITAQNYTEIEYIFRFCRDNNIIPYITANLHGGRTNSNHQLDIHNDQIKELFYKILKIDQESYGFSWSPTPPIIASQCKKLLYDIVVDYKGHVLLCPGIDIVVGNLKNDSLENIIKKSELIKKIRNMPATLTGKCQSCKNPECQYGCRLEALAINNDLFSSDPICWI